MQTEGALPIGLTTTTPSCQTDGRIPHIHTVAISTIFFLSPVGAADYAQNRWSE